MTTANEYDVEYVYELSLADRDFYLEQIESQIKAKKEFLLSKKKILNETLEENKFLENVKKDYNKYFQYVVEDKKKQQEAMKTLSNYLDNLIVSGKLTEKDIKQSKKDQQAILKEIDKIKASLDEILANS